MYPSKAKSQTMKNWYDFHWLQYLYLFWLILTLLMLALYFSVSHATTYDAIQPTVILIGSLGVSQYRQPVLSKHTREGQKLPI